MIISLETFGKTYALVVVFLVACCVMMGSQGRRTLLVAGQALPCRAL